jgi:hypothetical protein
MFDTTTAHPPAPTEGQSIRHRRVAEAGGLMAYAPKESALGLTMPPALRFQADEVIR